MGDLMFTPRGTGFKSAAKSKEWKSQERLHISNVLRWSKSPSHLGMAQLRITTINSSLLLSKSANRAAGEPRYSISQCFTLCDVESQLLRHILQHSRHSCTQAIDSEADDQQPKDATSKASHGEMMWKVTEIYYPLVNVYVSMENHHFSWENSL